MGRHCEFIGCKFFSYTKNTAVCNIPGCEYSYSPKPGSQLHLKPLIEHLKRKHSEQYKEDVKYTHIKRTQKRTAHLLSNYFVNCGESSTKTQQIQHVEFEVSKEKVQQFAVEAVTVNGLPLSVFEKSGIAKMIKPVLCKIGISLNRENICLLTLQAAAKKMSDLKAEFLGRMVCVKTDLCTHQGRHFLGINFQAIINGNLKTVTATVKEMTQRTTGSEICETLVDCLQEFGIHEQQIYTLTTDNGSNVVKASELVQKQTTIMVEKDEDIYFGTDADNSSENEYLTWNDKNITAKMLGEALSDIITVADCVVSVRCATHTLQLSVDDVINTNENIKMLLTRVRMLVNKMHAQNKRLIFKQNRKPLPKLDCETCWVSTYGMLLSLVDNKAFLHQMALANESFLFLESEWESIECLLQSLKPVYETTVTLRLRNFTAGQFLAEWMKCKVRLKKDLTTNSLYLLRAMEKREEILFYNASFLSAIYLDPRFQCLLEQQQKNIAKNHLSEFWKMSKLEGRTDAIVKVENVDEAHLGNDEDTDIIDQLLSASDKGMAASVTAQAGGYVIEQLIEGFDNMSRVDRNEDIFKWWQYYPRQEMRKLAEVAVAFPVTQVSAQRTFSGLRYILDELRPGPKNDIIDAIMLLRCNT